DLKGQGVVAQPEGQGLFHLARLLLAEGPPSLRGVAVRVLGGLSRQPARGSAESSEDPFA
ncbi:hypothetical protein, partial [Thermus hydrothermalis]